MANWLPPPVNMSSFQADVKTQLPKATWRVTPTNPDSREAVASKLEAYAGKTEDGWVFFVVRYEQEGVRRADGTANIAATIYHLSPDLAKEALDAALKFLNKKEDK